VPGQTVADLLDVANALQRLDRILAGQANDADLADADWTLEDRLGRAMASVGLANLPLHRPADSLSGGERTRARIAQLLMSEPDLIILDEPTNHLDADGRAAIGKLLDGWTAGAVVVSHDRSLLQQMDRIVEITSPGHHHLWRRI
jgi:ATPase components of ABC transporters with duplicated ATPase domains